MAGEEVADEPVFVVRQYRNDVDYLYNQEDEEQVLNALNEMGFGPFFGTFVGARIDMESFNRMSEKMIWRTLIDYPPGLVMKFIARYEEYQSIRQSNASKLVLKICDGIVENILCNTKESENFYRKLDKSKPLSVNDSKMLRNYILSPFLANEIILSISDIEIISKDIKNCLPNESIEIYFDSETRTGLLYTDYHNKVKTLREEQLFPTSQKKPRKKQKIKDTMTPNSNDNQETTDNAYALHSDEIIRTATSSMDLTEVLSHWRNSSRYRFNQIKQITSNEKITKLLHDYKQYTKSDGYMFIAIDFEINFPTANQNFKEKFFETEDKLMDILKKCIKNDLVKSYVETYDTANPNSKAMLLLLALHSFLYCHKSISKKGKGFNRPTMLDTIKYMVICTDESNIEMVIQKRKKEIMDLGLTLQPFIIVKGESFTKVTENVVLVFDQVKYIFTCLISGLAALVKIYEVFDLAWPKANEAVYSFIEYFYLEIDHGKQQLKIKQLIDQFNAKK